MSHSGRSDADRGGFSRRRFLQGAAGGVAGLAGAPLLRADAAQAAAANPIVTENRLVAGRSPQFRLQNYSGAVCGFATATSVNRGQAVDLKLISYFGPDTTAVLKVYRLGYYGGMGGRLVYESPSFTLPTFAQQGDAVGPALFGLRQCSAWSVTRTVPASVTGVTGMYLVRLEATDPGNPAGPKVDNHIPFVVRDDARARDLLVAMPTNTWQAYNAWAGKSLYTYNSNGPGVGSAGETIAGTSASGRSRAVKASFDRPYLNVLSDYNWVLRTEFPLIHWLERQGYNLTYTDDLGLHSQPQELLKAKTRTLVIAGHGEYWTSEARTNVEAARDNGTNIASFSANAAYWQVRFEPPDGGGAPARTLVCFKTVQGTDANGVDAGMLGANDFGPPSSQQSRGGVNDPLGAGGTQGGSGAAADKPQFATTTFRDRGAAAGSPNAPNDSALRGAGRVGPNRPENALFGVLYIGDDDSVSYPLEVPAGSGSGLEFGAHSAWRHTAVARKEGISLGSNIIGWEWDAVPRGGAYASFANPAIQPRGVRRLAETTPTPPPSGAELEYLRDDGRVYSPSPDPAQGPAIHAVTYRHASGALVFSAGTIQWSWGLGPHFEAYQPPSGPPVTYQAPPVDSHVFEIQQATYNILADGGVKPATPDGIILDSTPQPPPKPPAPKPPVVRPKTPPPKATPPRLRITRSRVVARDGVAKVAVHSLGQTCSGTLHLFALIARRSRSGRRLKPKRVKIGARKFSVGSKQRRGVRVRLTRRGRALAKRRGGLKVSAVAEVSDLSGNRAKPRSTFRLVRARSRSR